MIIPTHLQIEPINGVCTSKCIMCTYQQWTRDKNIMSNDVFTRILEKFLPYRENLQYLTLHGDGEALIDKGLPQKVKIAKDMGFKGIGFATNCTLLDVNTANALMQAGLDTIICSIDGIKKETHEAIRIGTNFEKCVSNVQSFINLRNSTERNTRVMVRFIRQELNKGEWPEFEKFWSKRINKKFGDEVVKFDVHNWGDELEDYAAKDINRDLQASVKCQDMTERLYIHSTGRLALCSADYNGFYDLGNVLEDDPISLYNNSPIIKHYRTMLKEGRFMDLKYCRSCTIPRSRSLKE
ncbi:MAG: SPASM domain-containing protein [Desulfobacterales bacterium]